MSKPDSTGESLESILASIRRSLAEQSTGALEDEPAGPATLLPPDAGTPDDADAPRLFGGAGAAPSEMPSSDREPPISLEDDPPPPPSTLTARAAQEEPAHSAPSAPADVAPAGPDDPPAPAAASVPFPLQATAKDSKRDPFWFLGGRGEADKKDAAPAAGPEDAPRPAPSGLKAPPPSEPKPMRAEVVRGPLPPFFGSSAEAAKVEVAPVPAVAAGASAIPPGSAPVAEAPARAAAEPPRAPAWPSSSPLPPQAPASALFTTPLAPPMAREGLPNGKAAPIAQPPAPPAPGPAPAAGAADALPHVRGLEAMVAELLRPMLRRWLDENMPRLVSAALKAEADLMSRRDPKKP
jgi:hypothetical protein